MAKAAYNHFADVLGTATERDITLNLHALCVPQFDLHELESPFFEDEI